MNAAADPVAHLKAELGRVSLWSAELRFAGPEAGVAFAQEIEGLGFPAVWTPGGIDGKVLDDIGRLLPATKRITLCTGILNLWKIDAAEVGAWWRSHPPEHQARVLIGVGVSHAPNIGEAYKKPVEAMRAYVQSLLDEGLPRDRLCLAALGPRMLELSAELTAGAHPYLVSVEHTAEARRILGKEPLLAPELGVILESDPARARELGRQALDNYLRLPNYLNSWRRLGFSEDDIKGSDRLIDALFAWGDVDALVARVKAHLDAGADHVCLQAITGPMMSDLEKSRTIWREMAAALLS